MNLSGPISLRERDRVRAVRIRVGATPPTRVRPQALALQLDFPPPFDVKRKGNQYLSANATGAVGYRLNDGTSL
jgi:hypothetical protein